MPTIDLSVDFEDVKDADVFKPLPEGTYEFTVKDIEAKDSRAGRPMLVWNLEFTHKGKPYSLRYYSVLPWDKDGEVVTIGLGNLVSMCKAVGIPWTGGSLTTEDYLSATGMAQIVQKTKQELNPDTGEYEDTQDPDALPVNDIKKVFPK